MPQFIDFFHAMYLFTFCKGNYTRKSKSNFMTNDIKSHRYKHSQNE